MAKYKVGASWEMCGYLEIEADSPEEALEIAERDKDHYPLPEPAYYVDASFWIDHECGPFEADSCIEE